MGVRASLEKRGLVGLWVICCERGSGRKRWGNDQRLDGGDVRFVANGGKLE